ncbi:MAG: hypothetical protein CV081_02110 [Nitrospira sp. LK265]|nr:DUF3443 domain-containing protein [Nitrospira sp.]NGZ59284.1 hypothetical protein [Nitrospira sp. LK265]
MMYRAIVIACLWLVSACGSGGGGNGGAGSSPTNVLTVTVGGSEICTNVNSPCTQVTICQPGTSTCQTISDMLVDTGSTGVRIFGSVLSIPLQQEVESPGQPIGECQFFADGSALWGSVQLADVVLAGEPAVTVPIHVIAATFAGQTSTQNPCNNPVETDPQEAEFNGILGIGLLTHDCGTSCEINDNNNRYFSCTASTCGSIAAPLSTQVQNPVWLLPSDNNGVILTLPNVPSAGAPSLSGSVILGIGTASNNSPSPNISTFTTNQDGSLTTVYNGTTFPESIIDTGSNGYFFPDSTLPVCPIPQQDFYCPPAAINLSATLFSVNGRQAPVPFQVANAASLLRTGNAVFSNLGGPSPSSSPTFDWGLPFFLGRVVFVAIEGQSSTLGTGPLYAF